mgnify:CR=1 FL=1
MNNNNELLLKMIAYDAKDPKRIQHFLKVYEFAKIIGESEGLDAKTQHILETAAIVHDIGIKNAEAKFGNCSGKLQEQEGPAPARELLSSLSYDSDVIERVCYLVAHHHTYTNVDGLDYQILLEADFLVNLYEDGANTSAISHALEHIFQTDTGIHICKTMFL